MNKYGIPNKGTMGGNGESKVCAYEKLARRERTRSHSPRLSVGNVHVQVLPSSANTTHHLLGDDFSPGQGCQLAVDDLPREMVGEGVLCADFFTLARCAAQRRVDALDQEAVANRVGNRGDLGVERILGVGTGVWVKRAMAIMARRRRA